MSDPTTLALEQLEAAQDEYESALHQRYAEMASRATQAELLNRELLEALEHVRNCIEEGVEIDMVRVRPAIAKARGAL